MTQSFATTSQAIYNAKGQQVAGVNDIYIGADGNLAVATGLQAVLYACANAAKAQRGEMIFQTNEGLPNFQLLWVGNPNIEQWRVALQTTLENVPGVQEVISLTADQVGNRVVYLATILTIYGSGVINGEF